MSRRWSTHTYRVDLLGVEHGAEESGEHDLRGGELQVGKVGQVLVETPRVLPEEGSKFLAYLLRY